MDGHVEIHIDHANRKNNRLVIDGQKIDTGHVISIDYRAYKTDRPVVFVTFQYRPDTTTITGDPEVNQEQLTR